MVVWGVCAGCPSGEAPAAPRPEVGRRYRFALGGEGELTQVYEVQSVTPSEVVYTVTTARGEQEVGEPVRLSFSRLREAPPTPTTARARR